MIVKHKYNGKEYTLTNENLQVGDKVYSISWGRSDSKNFTWNHEYFDWRNLVSGWKSEPHTILDLHHSDYKPYEVHTDHGYGPVESYFKILYVEPILKLRSSTGTSEAVAFAMNHEMSNKKPVKFLYYDEKKLNKIKLL
jgi:hypothetical protein